MFVLPPLTLHEAVVAFTERYPLLKFSPKSTRIEFPVDGPLITAPGGKVQLNVAPGILGTE
jgi:hypothetical protein